MKKNVIIDCDPGADDALALMLAVNSPELNILAVTAVAGNRDVAVCARNALKVLEHYSRTDIPVCVGEGKPLCRELCLDDIYSGRDGMAETWLPFHNTPVAAKASADVIAELAREHAGDIHIISIAPMTNIAAAVSRYPDILPMIASIITINGSYGVNRRGGRCNSRVEWNVTVDPEAAKTVLESGIEIRAMGVDVTGELSNGLYQNLLAKGESAAVDSMPYRFLRDAGMFLKGRSLEPAGLFVDAMAVAYAVDPQIAGMVHGRVAVETKGEITTGATVFDNAGNISNRSNVYAAYEYSFGALERMLSDRVLL